MSDPIVFISHFRVKEGKLDRLRELFHDVAGRLEAEKPRTLVFLAYLDPDGTRVTIVHVFGDADSMDLHVQGADERSRTAYELVDPEEWEIYGSPSQPVMEMMLREAAAAGVTMTVEPRPLAGFLRLQADQGLARPASTS